MMVHAELRRDWLSSLASCKDCKDNIKQNSLQKLFKQESNRNKQLREQVDIMDRKLAELRESQRHLVSSFGIKKAELRIYEFKKKRKYTINKLNVSTIKLDEINEELESLRKLESFNEIEDTRLKKMANIIAQLKKDCECPNPASVPLSDKIRTWTEGRWTFASDQEFVVDSVVKHVFDSESNASTYEDMNLGELQQEVDRVKTSLAELSQKEALLLTRIMEKQNFLKLLTDDNTRLRRENQLAFWNIERQKALHF